MTCMRFVVICLLSILVEKHHATCESTAMRFGDMHCSIALREAIESPRYDRLVPPFSEDGSALSIAAAIYIEGISSVQTITMDFSMDIYFIIRWEDKRIKYSCDLPDDSTTILPNTQASMLWSPDIFFANSRLATFSNVLHRNANARVSSTGSVRASTRVTLKAICNMNLEFYPFDTQECELTFMDFSFPNSMINLTWMPNEIEPPAGLNKHIVIPEMDIVSVTVDYCNGNYTSGVWSCLVLKIVIHRITGGHLYQTYLPTALIVLTAFSSFWLDVDAMPGRISLSITTLLTLTTQASTLRLSLPPVSYMKAVDVWMIMCQFFVLGVLLEFTIVNYTLRRFATHKRGSNQQPLKDTETKTDPTKYDVAANQKMEGEKAILEEAAIQCRYRAQSIDNHARIVFPLMFLLFNIIYWSYYMIRAERR